MRERIQDHSIRRFLAGFSKGLEKTGVVMFAQQDGFICRGLWLGSVLNQLRYEAKLPN